jgi:hypothetical protein
MDCWKRSPNVRGLFSLTLSSLYLATIAKFLSLFELTPDMLRVLLGIWECYASSPATYTRCIFVQIKRDVLNKEPHSSCFWCWVTREQLIDHLHWARTIIEMSWILYFYQKSKGIRFIWVLALIKFSTSTFLNNVALNSPTFLSDYWIIRMKKFGSDGRTGLTCFTSFGTKN